ncbi:putative phage-type endonuclease [Janthinobacterium sp. TND4EL3]|uniref:YqaJ viral recombinase family protein n=1 Tax=Janthinobacterium sp. TND4EL3 TaxID=1907311 RepID=UPI000954BA3F|nr:YqaJ viral recombinase family protein [Janthinobacterium sp. TND4EL3]SIR42839.1 putative phage-type endonuclease [Janthinobacterium sp. TND4EL3]
MEQHELTQGTPEWLAYRVTHRNASDAPAMMGVSPYKTRNQLLHEVHTGLAAEIDAHTQMRFDDGHRFEALARPRAEELIGESLYPVVGSLGTLSASFDGLTICDDTAWEHKTLNDSLRAAIRQQGGNANDFLAPAYRIQMEQQLLVSGADRALFLATRWEGDALAEERYCWYTPDQQLRAEIVAGWEQFEIDLVNYVPAAQAEKPEAEAIIALPSLVANIRGEVTLTNLPTFKEQAEHFIAGIKTDLQDDQDFANAELTIKYCDTAEKDIERAKAAAIAQTASIDDLMRTVDLIKDQLRTKRLMLTKLVDRRKLEIKETILAEAKSAYADHVAALEAEIKPLRLAQAMPDFAGTTKNKRTMASLHDAVDTLLASAKIATNTMAADFRAKQNWCRENAASYGFLFMDMANIIGKPMDDFQLVITTRIADHKRTEEAKAEAERARIREEERVKAEEAAAETIRLAQIESDRLAAAAAQVERERAAADTQRQLAEQASQLTAERAVEPVAQVAASKPTAPIAARRAPAATAPVPAASRPAPAPDLLDAAADDLYPSDSDILDVMFEQFGLTAAEAIERLAKFDFAAEYAALITKAA